MRLGPMGVGFGAFRVVNIMVFCWGSWSNKAPHFKRP